MLIPFNRQVKNSGGSHERMNGIKRIEQGTSDTSEKEENGTGFVKCGSIPKGGIGEQMSRRKRVARVGDE